jgi:DNA-binding SARP family transcriptional activator
MAQIVGSTPCHNLAGTLNATRVQLCGQLVVRIEGRRVEHELRGRQVRLAFAYLAAHRNRSVVRDELLDALWAEPPAREALNPVLSKLRRVVPIAGRRELQLELDNDAWVDLEAAAEGLHRAETAIARGDWAAAWSPARVAQHIAVRGFFPDEDALWVRETHQRLEEIHLRSLEVVGRACLGIGGAELDTAERSARTLLALAPYREAGHRLLMQTLASQGNSAEALLVYEELRQRLRTELGAAPSAQTQELHRSLLR